MSRWNHPICEECWKRREPDRAPVRVYPEVQTCCICGKKEEIGIYVRIDPTYVDKCTRDH